MAGSKLMRTKRTTMEVAMCNIASLILTIVLMLSTFSSASAGEGYIKGPNGRLTYWNDGQPGYIAPRVHRHQYYQPRSSGRSMYLPRYQRNPDRSDGAVAGIILFGAGAAIGAAIANSQRHEHSSPLSPREACFESRGIWVFNPDINEELCALPY